MVNKYWQAPIHQAQQKQIEAKLRSGEYIIQDGKIILNEPFLKKQAQIQQLKANWRKEQTKRADQAWERRLTHLEKCLAELAKGGKGM